MSSARVAPHQRYPLFVLATCFLLFADESRGETEALAAFQRASIPAGRGWFCVPRGQQVNRMGGRAPGEPAPLPPSWCRRALRQCSVRDEGARWTCLPQRVAHCFTFGASVHSGTFTGSPSLCTRSRASCVAERDRMTSDHSEHVSYHNISDCQPVR